MNILERLQNRNPDLPLYSVTDPAFAPYGQILPCADPSALSRAMEKTGIPERGNRYTRATPNTDISLLLHPIRVAVLRDNRKPFVTTLR